jgi:O-antigen/teichoic acid export membrane protein
LILGWFFPKYQGSAALMSVVLWAAPWRALGSLMGGVLIATNRSGDTVGLNLVCLMVAGALQWGLVARWGVWGSAWAILLSDLFMLTLYGGYVLLQLGRRGRSQ